MSTAETQATTVTELMRIAWLSAQNPKQEFHSLMHHINVEALTHCYHQLDGKKAKGADGISKEAYGAQLQSHLEVLIAKMKRMAYRPGMVRQVQIPKEGKANATRSLGISNFEDKLVQKRMQELLESIYEPIFLEMSYGFRPGRSGQDAIKELLNYLYQEREVETVIEVDIANFFGQIDHSQLIELLGIKIKDRVFLRYISRLLKAGVLSQGELTVSEEGVVQGSCCSPVLANIYAHYVIDRWLEGAVQPKATGKIKAFRYADDLIICCQYEKEAHNIKAALAKRLAKFNLSLNEEKTKCVPFSKVKHRQGSEQGQFDFLGFTFYLGQSRSGKGNPMVKTSRSRMRSKLKKVNHWAKQMKRQSLDIIWKTFCSKLRGHGQYYGVSYNIKSVTIFYEKATRILFKHLNRRSQRKSMNWEQFKRYMHNHPLPKVRIYHSLFMNVNNARMILS